MTHLGLLVFYGADAVKMSCERPPECLEGYSLCLVFLKLFERIYAPLTAGLLSPVSGDTKLQHQKRCQLDRLYQRVIDDLDKLIAAVGLKAARNQSPTRTKSSLRCA